MCIRDRKPIAVIKTLLQEILVKGADYDQNEIDPSSKRYIVGSDIVRRNGGDVLVIDFVEGFSTTSIISRLKK